MALKVVGLDGFKARWVAVTLEDGRFASARLVESVAAASAAFHDAQVIAVDIPIGLPEGHGRRADRAAKEFVGPRRNSVFLTVPRVVLEARTHVQAVAKSKQLTGAGISAQTYALREKIFEAEAAASEDERIIEVHPEVSFRAMGGKPLTHSKKTWTGLVQRVALLRAAGIAIFETPIGDVGQAPPDDVLDAAAAAWSAHRKALGQAGALPNCPERGAPGIIWY